MSEEDKLDKKYWAMAKADYQAASLSTWGSPSWENLTDEQRNTLRWLAQRRAEREDLKDVTFALRYGMDPEMRQRGNAALAAFDRETLDEYNRRRLPGDPGPVTCPTHGAVCIGFDWCRICATQVSVHTHSHPVAEYQEFDRQANAQSTEAAADERQSVRDTREALQVAINVLTTRLEGRSQGHPLRRDVELLTALRESLKLDYYDPARQNLISEHDCSFEDGSWWFGHGMPCTHPELHGAPVAIAYIEATWLGNGKPTRNTPAGEIIAILRGERD